MGKRRMERNYIPQKSNSIEDVLGNEENGYSVPDSNKTMINVTNEPIYTTKKSLEGEIREKMRNSWRRYTRCIQEIPRHHK
jgi:hypothetical protein